jgi:hypothetical protein
MRVKMFWLEIRTLTGTHRLYFETAAERTEFIEDPSLTGPILAYRGNPGFLSPEPESTQR